MKELAWCTIWQWSTKNIGQSIMIWWFSWPTFLSQDESVELGKKNVWHYSIWFETSTHWRSELLIHPTSVPRIPSSYFPYTRRCYTKSIYTHIYIYIYEYLCIDKYAMICNIVPNSKIYPQKVETRRFTFRAIEQTVGTMGLLRMTRIAGSHGSRVDWWIVLFPKRWGGWRPGYWDGEKLWEKPMTLIRLGC